MKHGLYSAATKLFAVAAFTAWLPQTAFADTVTPPGVPDNLKVETGNKAFLVGHAFGTQNYICLPSGTGFAFSLFTPEATLLDDDDGQIITHYFSPTPNPDENGAIRATWQHSRDSSLFFGTALQVSTDAKFVASGAIPWVLLGRSAVRDGPTGGDVLANTTFVQRVNTHGGVAPPTGCASSSDVGKKAFVPYTADYFFYKSTGAGAD
jgi:hypothetical protein